ncbi:hypothetical protein ACFS7Z_08615 [Pontibacter toksunensis]|uniref:Uncharacterized protein n=1 Tax=Pontibacter toksunensis TaxID=1332631 RepID=A0ABW6BTH6_9BACT
MANPLKAELDIFLHNISLTNLMFYQTSTHLKNQKESLLKQFEGHEPEKGIMGTSLVIGDLTGPTDKGFKIYYHTGKVDKVKVKDIEESVEKLISREGMRSTANCYEILESFLFDITASYLYNNPEEQSKAAKIASQECSSLEEYKEKVRKYRGQNNAEIIKLLRHLSVKLNESEKPRRHNISEWYQVISHVRHAVVHSLFKMNKNRARFTDFQKELFEHYFTFDEDSHSYNLRMTKKESERQIILVAEYGFHIFKCLSLEKQYDWQVFTGMKA